MAIQIKTHPVIKRHPANPVLTDSMVPYPAGLVFNAGVTKFQGRYVMVFRNDVSDMKAKKLLGKTNLGLAFSKDGVTWEVEKKPCFDLKSDEISRAYDPRLTVIDGRCYMCFAVDTKHGVRGGIAVTDDFETFEVLHMTVPDNRNMVLFPEKIGGLYVRLERPFPVYSRGKPEAFDVWFARSPDLRYWGDMELVLGAEQVSWVNNKIGPAAPPVKTPKGWLTLFHGVDKDDTRANWGWEGNWKKRYSAGIMLLDLQEPWKIVGICPDPLIVPEPEIAYEAHGFRDYVIFPGGMILEPNGEVKMYYGAADTVECLATAHVDELVGLCLRK